MSKLEVLVAVIAFVAFTAGVIGLVIPLWYTTELPQGTAEVHVKKKIYAGLWHTCTKTEYTVSDDYNCDVILDTALDTHGLKAVQATTIIGLALLCGVVLVVVIDLVCLEKREWLSKVIGGIGLLSGVFLLVGPIVYATDVRNDYNFDVLDLNACFGLTIDTALITLFCSAIACVMYTQKKLLNYRPKCTLYLYLLPGGGVLQFINSPLCYLFETVIMSLPRELLD